MSRYRVILQGAGSADVQAYGVGDAEAQLEKELGRCLPGAHLHVRGIRRTADDSRIVEEFRIEYGVRVELASEGAGEDEARRAAFAAARAALLGSRFERLGWERGTVERVREG